MTSCQFNATLGGIGDFVVASATSLHATPATMSVINNKTYTYYAQCFDTATPPNVVAWEAGNGQHITLTATQKRTTITANSNGDLLPVNFPTPPIVDIYASSSPLLESPFATGGGYSNIKVVRTAGNYITITADLVVLSDGSGNMRGVSVSNTVDLNVTGAGGMDVGTGAASTAYNYFVIWNPTNNAVAGLFSNVSNGNSPTLPAGYTFKRRIGWCITNGASAIFDFTQRNDKFTYSTARVIASGTNAAAFFSLVGFVPPTAALVRVQLVSNNNTVMVSDNAAQLALQITGITSGQCFWYAEFVVQNGSLQLYHSSSSGGGQVGVQSWEDNI